MLSEGEVADGAIECWLNSSRFDLATNRAVSPPATQPVAVFSLRVDGGDVYICLTPDRQRLRLAAAHFRRAGRWTGGGSRSEAAWWQPDRNGPSQR